MYYVRTAGGSMMPVKFKTVLLGADKKATAKAKKETSKKQNKRSIFGSK